MNKDTLKISPDFTIEDIHKIREANEMRRHSIPKEAYRAEMRSGALRMQERIQEIRKKRLASGTERNGLAIPFEPGYTCEAPNKQPSALAGHG